MLKLLAVALSIGACALCAMPALADDAAPSMNPPQDGHRPRYDPSWFGSYTPEEESPEAAPQADSADGVLSPEYAALGQQVDGLSDDCTALEFSLDSASSECMTQSAQLDCLGCELARGCRDWDSPFSGQITYRMRFAGSSLSDLGNFEQGVRFDLRYREWLSDNFLVNFEIGTQNDSVFDVIGGREGGDAQLHRAYLEGHFE